MKVMIRRSPETGLSVYVPKKDLEEPIVETEHETLWGGWVIRTADGTLPEGIEALCEAADALLIDTLAPGYLGGSGKTLPWDRLGESLDELDYHPRIVLAGGLTAENVAEAIDLVAPSVVDVSSGVEASPGVKDHARIRAFVAAVRSSREEE